jgi:ribosome-binding factor A
MPPDKRRPDRVAAAIREEIATFLAEGAKDPRIVGLVTVTSVEVSRDLRHAKVFVSVMGSDAERASTMEGLAGVAPVLRGPIGRALRLRLAPEIAFRLDESIARAARIETLLEQIKQGPSAQDEGPSD